jgi:ribonuclease BN (tRNA processing enzyme)
MNTIRNSLTVKRTLVILLLFNFLVALCLSSCLQSTFSEDTNQSLLSKSVPPDTQRPSESSKDYEPKSDFSVITLGTGNPIYNPKRSGPSTLVRYKENYFLVDMGNGTQARLSECGIPIGKIGTLMLTHHHIDHNEEFVPILMRVWLGRGDNETIVGPPGTKELYDFTFKYYKEDLAYRSSRINREFNGIVAMNVRELTGGSSMELNEVQISSTQVVHSIFTIAYRFEVKGKSIVISGDTAYSENLVDLAKSADILVMDSGNVIMKRNSQLNQSPSQGSRPSPAAKEILTRAHSTLQEVATMAQKAQVKCLVLTHFGLGEVDKEATTAAIKTIFNGTIIFSEDLMEISCPIGKE